jgi:hypothetical protein
MNIEDITVNWELYEGRDLLEVLFEKQDELRVLYKIEIQDLDTPQGQQVLRSFAWCVIEETSEAIDVLMTTDHRNHLLDEIGDTISFYIELLIISGLTRNDFSIENWEANRNTDQLPNNFMTFTSSLAIAINSLKNRSWRKTNLKTDRVLFYLRLKKTLPLICKLIESMGLSFNDLIDAYLKKHEVNLFRVRSAY